MTVYKGKKSKKAQYIDRRRTGMPALEARRRTYLGREVAYRYERAYQEVAKEDAATQKAAQAQETASLEAEKDAADRQRREREDRQRRKTAAIEAPKPVTPRCKRCGADHCGCAVAPMARPFEGTFIDPVEAYKTAQKGYADNSDPLDPSQGCIILGGCPRGGLAQQLLSNPGLPYDLAAEAEAVKKAGY